MDCPDRPLSKAVCLTGPDQFFVSIWFCWTGDTDELVGIVDLQAQYKIPNIGRMIKTNTTLKWFNVFLFFQLEINVDEKFKIFIGETLLANFRGKS